MVSRSIRPAGKIYWADFDAETIRVGNLNGLGTPATLFTEPVGSAPSGVAIDPWGARYLLDEPVR